ncbi:MAG: secondary thiamine-phosphate synthase [Desulfobulbaceae bacterium]|jgi:secondary thiamine-phosphate synthase enzyme|nr:MAG: secondary thiamine-phosphate synthase [Desulfobulbaceae bacterium]
MAMGTISITTSCTMQLVDITSLVQKAIGSQDISEGVCYLFNPHTTAGLTINEGADPAVKDDILAGLLKIVPLQLAYKHLEGNSPAHIMASLMGAALTVFISNKTVMLGTWQKIFFCEFDGPRSRNIHWRIIPANL